MLQALDKKQKLTELGKQMAMFPLDPIVRMCAQEAPARTTHE